MQILTGWVFWVVLLGIFFLVSAVKILSEYERAVIFRLGRALGISLLQTGPCQPANPTAGRFHFQTDSLCGCTEKWC